MRTRWGVAVRIKSARLMWLTETVMMHYNNKDGMKRYFNSAGGRGDGDIERLNKLTMPHDVILIDYIVNFCVGVSSMMNVFTTFSPTFTFH